MEFLDQIFVNLNDGLLDFLARFLPEWVVVLKRILIAIIAILILGPVIMMYLTWFERKVVGRMQNRIGPNRVGPWGLLQPVADGIKMLTKEDIVPDRADPALHFLAPALLVVPALLGFCVIPFGRNMTAVDLNVGLLFFLAVGSTSTLSIFMASWGSRNKYSLLGGMRAVAQMISYEIPMVLALVPVILSVGSLSTNSIVEAQQNLWFVFTPWGLVAFVTFFLSGVAECNRSPFDLPEAESEIIAGFHTEYSGMKFALFYMAEFINAFAIAAIAATVFLGGWQGPLLPSWLWFFIKTISLIFIMVWFRGTLPRVRVDQLMALAWKFMLPLTLVNILVAAGWYFLPNSLSRILVSVITLGVAFSVLTRLNRPYTPETRVYEMAD